MLSHGNDMSQMMEAMLTQKQKAAIVLMELGLDSSVEMMQRFSQKTFQTLVAELQSLDKVTAEQRREVVREFTEALESTPDEEPLEGKSFVSAMLRRTVEQEQFQAIDLLQTAEKAAILDIIKTEHPQVGAFILAYLPPKMGAQVLSALPMTNQRDLSVRVATLKPPNPIAMACLDKTLSSRLDLLSQEKPDVGGVRTLLNLLKDAGRATEREVLEEMDQRHPDLADEMRKNMFTFEDMEKLDDLSFQKVLRQVDGRTLALALKRASEDLKEMVMRNLSERARLMLESDIDALGKVKVSEVEAAQQEVVDYVRSLEEAGEIRITKGDEEMI